MFESRARQADLGDHDGSQSSGSGIPQHNSVLQAIGSANRPDLAGRSRLAVRPLCILLLVGCCACLGNVLADDPADEPLVLFRASNFPQGWRFYSAEPNVKLADVFQAQAGDKDTEDVLVCTGRPFGYLKTENTFENFELSLEWSYPDDPNCNSGILICTNGEDKIWPTSIQVQLHRPTAGSIFPIGDAKVDKNAQVKAADLAVAEWHKCVIRCEGGRIAVSVNGIDVGRVTGCTPQKGAIALQSEGSEIRFRRITLKKIK